MIALPAAGFRLVRYFTMTSLTAFLVVVTALWYSEHLESDFFRHLQQEQHMFFMQMQDSVAKQQDEAARGDMLRVHEAGNVNLTRLFANALWEKDFALFVAKVQRIPVDQCGAIADHTDANGRTAQMDAKKACYAEIRKKIMALPEFQALDAEVFDMMKKSTVFKIKVFDLRGITVYSSEHDQIGEDKAGNAGWESAMAGKPASELTHRDKFSAFEGVVENRDLIGSYLPILAPGSEKIVAVFEVYSDVTQFIEQIRNASIQIKKLSAENQVKVKQAVAARQGEVDESRNLRFAIILSLLTLFYVTLFLVVRHGQRIIDRQDFERKRTDERLRLQSTALDAAANAIIITDREGVIRWANPAFTALTGYAVEEAVGCNLRELIRSEKQDQPFYKKMWATIQAGQIWHGDLVNRRKDGALYTEEMTITPVRDAGGDITDFIAVKQDVTERKRAEVALARQKDLYDMLSQTNEAIVRLTSRDELFSTICRVAVERGRFSFAWVGLTGKEDQRVKPVAKYGEDTGYVDQLSISADESDATSRGPTGQALRTGRPVVCNDFLNSPTTVLWHEAARRAGVRASAAFPIRQGGAVVGTIQLYASEPGFFTEDLLPTLEEIATDVSFALNNFAGEAARKQAEEALRQSHDQHQALIESIDGVVWEGDARTFEFTFVSQQAERLLGYPVERWISETTFWHDHIHPDDRDRAVNYCAAATREMRPHQFEYRFIAADGRTVWLADIVSVVVENGAPVKLRGLMADITERKRAEQALRAAEEQFRGLVEQSIAGIYIIQDGRLAYVNPRYAEIFGYGSADEVTGGDALAMIAEKDRGVVAENIRRQLQGESHAESYTATAQRKDGSMIEIGVHGAGATYRDRPAVIGLMQDISEKKRAEEQINHYIVQLENTFMRTVEIVTTLSEMRDPYTAGHERRVGEIAVAIGAELGFDARRQEGLRVAGYLHDIGKITIPSEILVKPGKLSPIEFLLLQGHAQASYDILKDVEFPWPVAQVALQHHERLDGSGYPRGLKGEAILLEARIMAVADVVEAMSSHRPYRPEIGIDKALAEIKRGRGSVYDLVVADACLKLFCEKGYIIPV